MWFLGNCNFSSAHTVHWLSSLAVLTHLNAPDQVTTQTSAFIEVATRAEDQVQLIT